MKASQWTTAAVPKDYADVRVTVTNEGSQHIVLRRKNPNGTWSRMRIEMTRTEARALAFAILPPVSRVKKPG